MALLDVSIAILDPYFLDPMVRYRPVQTINSHGRAVNTSSPLPFYGVATNDSGDLLNRLANAAQVNGTITVHTLASLGVGNLLQDADIVNWNGGAYTVTAQLDYSKFGAGFVAVTCTPLEIPGVTPGELDVNFILDQSMLTPP